MQRQKIKVLQIGKCNVIMTKTNYLKIAIAIMLPNCRYNN